MAKPKEFNKALWLVSIFEISLFTLIGSVFYAMVGTEVSLVIVEVCLV